MAISAILYRKPALVLLVCFGVSMIFKDILFNFAAKFSHSAVRRPCFHCADLMYEREILPVMFDGEIRQVCCHGCVAVLQTVEQHGLQSEYYLSKLPNPQNAS